ncbi:MAG TPA: prepilin-type N-terminal cleavage/methylation domain-containing protein [Pyrinomonadaceae bacterium]
MTSLRTKKSSGGFSLLELLIAMAITITLMTAATTLLASALRTRSRENQKSDALADTQRALNIMTREIADAGFNLNNNGIVAGDSGLHTLRIRSNLNKYDFSASLTAQSGIGVAGEDASEDISYYTNLADNTKYLVRHDEYGSGSTVLANRIDNISFHYFDQKVTYTCASGDTDISNRSVAEVASPTQAKYVVAAIAVTLDQIGKPGSPGYQPSYSVLLCSDVALRNAGLWNY